VVGLEGGNDLTISILPSYWDMVVASGLLSALTR